MAKTTSRPFRSKKQKSLIELNPNKRAKLQASVDPEKFDWPQFNSDKERIRHMSELYRNMPIADAFASEYYNLTGRRALVKHNEEAEILPIEPVPGNILKARIIDIQKNKVVFDTMNLKMTMTSKVNLYKYARFKNNIPREDVRVKVLDVKKGNVVVDPVNFLADEWIESVTKMPIMQRPMNSGILTFPPITVRDLRRRKGGFKGKAIIPSASKFIGEPYEVDAFIPGSQIVLNIARDFNAFEGQTVQAFVTNTMISPEGQRVLVCSVKEYKKYLGDKVLIDLFNQWCNSNDGIAPFTFNEEVHEGVVTGVLNSSKKCGVFIEIPSLNITGMMAAAPDEISNYKPGDPVPVRITGFEEETFYNPVAGQLQHVEPYTIKSIDGNPYLERCVIKPILKKA